jgi:predicted nucleic acid-binding protein
VILLDTNVVSELMRPAPEPAVMRWMTAQDLRTLRVSSLSCAEILAGIARLPEGKRRQALAAEAEALFADDFAGHVLDFDLAAARAYAEITAGRQRAGRPIGAMDAMIAAIAAATGASLATRDGDLRDCGVAIVNPWSA